MFAGDLKFGGDGSQDPSLMSLLRTIYKWRRLIIALAVALPALTAVAVLLMPNLYTATGTILMEAKEALAGSDILGQLTALTGLPSQTPLTDVYLSILESRTVAEAVATSLDLSEHYGIDAQLQGERMEKTLLELRQRTEFHNPDPVTIHIKVTDPDPEVAAATVNAYLDQLAEANQTMALSRARRTRRLVETALNKTMADLDSLMLEVRTFQQTHGVFSLDDQTTATVELIAQLQGELLSAQLERDALAGFRKDRSAEIRSIDLRIEAIQSRIKKLVGNIEPGEGVVAKSDETGNDFVIPLSRIPDLAEEYARLVMDQKVLESKYSILAARLEQTKIEESQSLPSFEILDRAVRPFRKSGPNRKLYVLGALLAALLIGGLSAVLLEDLSHRLDDRTRSELVSMLPSFLARRFTHEQIPRAKAAEPGD